VTKQTGIQRRLIATAGFNKIYFDEQNTQQKRNKYTAFSFIIIIIIINMVTASVV
jgi:hypothetical protein